MRDNAKAVKDWRIRTKVRIIDAMGGRCNLCSYAKCNAAMELHHLDRTEKQFSFGGIRANPISWARIVEELRKCVLLCSNCHREVEAGVTDIPETVAMFNESYADYKEPPVVYTNVCKRCNNQFTKKRKGIVYCSAQCRSNKGSKIR